MSALAFGVAYLSVSAVALSGPRQDKTGLHKDRQESFQSFVNRL
jgi:hypothetical protein